MSYRLFFGAALAALALCAIMLAATAPCKGILQLGGIALAGC